MQIHLTLGKSRILMLSLLVTHGGGIVSLWLVELPNLWRFLVCAGVIYSLWRVSAEHGLRTGANSIVGLVVSADQWNLRQRNGLQFLVEPELGLFFCQPWLTLMAFRISGSRFRRWVLVPNDGCGEEEFRKLRFLITQMNLGQE